MMEPAKTTADTIAIAKEPPEAAPDESNTQDNMQGSKTIATPTEANNVPKSDETPSSKSSNALSPSNETQALGTEPTEDNIIKMLEKVQGILSQTKIKSDQKADAIQCIGWVINQVQAKGKEPRDSNADTDNSARLTNIEKELAEIKKAVMEPHKTYAEAARGPQVAAPHTQIQLEMAKRERLEQLRQERAKTEVTLTLQNASESVQMAIKDTSESEYTAIFQKAINESTVKDITIRKLQKLPGKLLKIYCHNEDDAKKLRKIEWEKIITGAILASQEYGIVLNGVPTNVLNPRTMSQKDMRELIQSTNDIDVNHVEMLTKNLRNPNAPTQSIIIFTNNLKKANQCHAAHIPMPRYQLYLKECFGCQ